MKYNFLSWTLQDHCAAAVPVASFRAVALWYVWWQESDGVVGSHASHHAGPGYRGAIYFSKKLQECSLGIPSYTDQLTACFVPTNQQHSFFCWLIYSHSGIRICWALLSFATLFCQ